MERRDRSPRQIYSWVTQQIVAAVAAGAPRFEMPWHRASGGLARPINATTGHAYRGINVLSLWIAAQNRGYATAAWATYRQWHDIGAQVRKGEKGTMIVFYKKLEPAAEQAAEDEKAEEPHLIAKASWVYNEAQVDNWIVAEAEPAFDPVVASEQAEIFVQAVGATIHEGGSTACYHRHADYIRMPPRSVFVGTSTSSATESYYSTLLHELSHWTGHESRLNRDFAKRYGDEAYAMEELVAELGAAFLCTALGVANVPRPDHAAYVQSWLRVLGNDTRAIFTAASKANAAVDYLGASAKTKS